MLAFVVTQSLRRSSQFEMLAKVFTGYGALVAAFCGAAGYGAEWKALLDLAPGAGWLDLWNPTSITITMPASWRDASRPSPLVLATTHFTNGKTAKIAVAGIAALMAASIFLSGSRGGMAAFRRADGGADRAFWFASAKDSWKQPLMLGAFSGGGNCFFSSGSVANELTRRLISIHSEARERD